jgi:hypothetical protein
MWCITKKSGPKFTVVSRAGIRRKAPSEEGDSEEKLESASVG